MEIAGPDGPNARTAFCRKFFAFRAGCDKRSDHLPYDVIGGAWILTIKSFDEITFLFLARKLS